MEKNCIRCNIQKDEALFLPKRNVCRQCHNKRQNQIYNDSQAHKNKKHTYFQLKKEDSSFVEKRKMTDKAYASRNPRGKLIRSIINNMLKERKTSEVRPWRNKHKISYNFLELRNHIEKQFLDGMTWDNRGDVWEIDHIIPISKFNEHATANEINSLSNLRPLWKNENQKKHSKIGADPYQITENEHNIIIINTNSKRPIVSYTLDGYLIKEYSSSLDVVKDGFNPTCVTKVCGNKEGRRKHKSVVFKYKDHG